MTTTGPGSTPGNGRSRARSDALAGRATPDLSIVIPLYNEEDNVDPLCEELTRVMEQLSLETEVVLIDDGSVDETFPRAAAWAARDERFRVTRLSCNRGQTIALQAGFDHARGRVVAVMDGDLQNDPADLPKLLDALDQGFDLVTGWRVRRQDAAVSRLLPSRIANWLLRTSTGIDIHDTGCALKVYRGEVTRSIRMYSDMHRFLPVYLAARGASYTEVGVNHRPRVRGESKYGISRVFGVIPDLLSLAMLTRFTHRPSRWFLLFSAPFLAAAVFGLVKAIQQIVGGSAMTVTYVAVTMLCSFAFLHLLFIALLSELVLKTSGFRISRQVRPTTIEEDSP